MKSICYESVTLTDAGHDYVTFRHILYEKFQKIVFYSGLSHVDL